MQGHKFYFEGRRSDRVVEFWLSYYHDFTTDETGIVCCLEFRQAREILLSSWMSTSIAASWTFTLEVYPNNTNQLVIQRRGKLYWHNGNRYAHNFTYFPAYSSFYDILSSKLKFSHTVNDNESYHTYFVPLNYISFFLINPYGEICFFLAGNDGFSYW